MSEEYWLENVVDFLIRMNTCNKIEQFSRGSLHTNAVANVKQFYSNIG